MRLISLVTATTVLIFSYKYDVQATSVSCTGKAYPKLYVFNSPYNSAGEYTLITTEYNGASVYQRTAGHYGGYYSIYRRQNGYWYLDFDEISEEYGGTIGYSDDNNKAFPWETGWKGDMVVLITKAVFIFGAPYPATSDGKYETDGTINQGSPVYARNVQGTLTYLYRRSDGKWYLGFTTPFPDSGGALLYGQNVVFEPWKSTFYPDAKVMPLLECDV